MTSSARRRVASNTAVQLAGKGAVLAIGLVSIAVLTRYLGPEDYGKYTLALMYMQLFGVLADVGLFTTVVREISKDPERTEELVGNALAAAPGPVDRGDRARRRGQPAAALRPPGARGDPDGRRAAADRDAHHDASWRSCSRACAWAGR